jgi:hypothetical protein
MGRKCDVASRIARLCVFVCLGLGLFWPRDILAAPISRAGSAFGLRLELQYVKQAEVPAVAAFVDEVERLIPPRVKAAIAGRVAVSFTYVDDQREVQTPACDGQATSAPQQLAEVSLSRDADTPHRIELHVGLKPILVAGRARSAPYSCGHRSLYQLAVATLLHEVLHIYDASTGLSREPRFAHLMRFARQGIARRLTARNELAERSPDPYELRDIRESLAVNAEYFLLDPEFRCRRPATYQFFESALGYRPFPHERCAVNDTVYARGEKLSLNPERIYQVHYLLASRGDGIASRFGHSMFRLIVCAEERERVGPECLSDVQDHLVLGFAANLRGDRGINPWKGLTGGYLSQLFVKPMSEVIIEYTEREFRDLESVPLRLSEEEKRLFIYRALEIYWSYQGRYYFLTNNCAVESLSLLKSVLSAPSVQGIERITPSGLRSELVRLGLATSEAGLEPHTAERLGLRFPSLFSKYDAVFRELSGALPKAAPRNLNGYLENTQAMVRRRWLRDLRGHDARPLVARAFALEGLILNRTLGEAERLLLGFLNRHWNDPRHRALTTRIGALIHMLSSDVPWRHARPGYGVPLTHELLEISNSARDRLAHKLLDEAFQILRDKFPQAWAEWRATRDNRSMILGQLLPPGDNKHAMH